MLINVVYKIKGTYTWEPEAWQGGATSALPFISYNQGEKGASPRAPKLALYLQYKYKKIRCELLTINFEIQKVPF